jgi:hypothetical protein
MNLKYLNLDLHGIPVDSETQLAVYLIASELKSRKLVNSLTEIGCDNCFCVSDLCNLVLAIVGFEDRPNQLYDFYFDLLDQYCDSVTHENDLPAKEALHIYKILKRVRQKYLTKTWHLMVVPVPAQ